MPAPIQAASSTRLGQPIQPVLFAAGKAWQRASKAKDADARHKRSESSKPQRASLDALSRLAASTAGAVTHLLPAWHKPEEQKPQKQADGDGLQLLARAVPWLWKAEAADEAAEHSGRSAAESVESDERPVLGLAGGGIFAWWEMGVVKYLDENFDLSGVQLIGVSAGALVGVLLACGVSFDRALVVANRLCEENNVWERPGGLAGIWGSAIRQWLDELLPEDAAERCQGRVKLIATEAPSLRLCYLESFASRQDLIDACMASVHIPFFLDGSATFSFRGGRYLDGSLWDFVSGANSGMLTANGRAAVVDYFMDDKLEYSRLDFIKLSSYEGVKQLVRQGYAYAQRTDAAGGFDETLGPSRKWLIRRVVEYPLHQLGRVLSPAYSAA